MGKSWLPLKDERLLSFCRAFTDTIAPAPEAFAMRTLDAVTLDTLVRNFEDALALNANPAARTRTIIAAKQMAKVALVAGMRIVYQRMTAANLSNAQREALGLPVVGAGHLRIAPAAAAAEAAHPSMVMPLPAESARAIAA